MPCSICNQYSYIAEKVSEIPSNTEELVLLIDFLKKSSDVTVFKLRRQLRNAIERLEFLMDYADLPRKRGAGRARVRVCVCVGACRGQGVAGRRVVSPATSQYRRAARKGSQALEAHIPRADPQESGSRKGDPIVGQEEETPGT